MYKLAVSQSDGAFAAAPSGPFAAAPFLPGRKAGKTRTLHLPYPVGIRAMTQGGALTVLILRAAD